MRIAIVYDAVYPYVKGGVEKRVYDLARSLSEKHEVCVFGMKYWKGPRLRTHGGVNYYGVCRPLKLYTTSGRRGLIEPLYLNPNSGQVTVKEFTPKAPGTYRFSCPMGMVRGVIEVVN